MKVLVTGGRTFADNNLLSGILNSLNAQHKFSALIHGDAPGADHLAGLWAKINNIPVLAYPANWRLYGRAAGPIRNNNMLNERPDMVVAFPGGAGTADMVKKARQAGITIVPQVLWHGDQPAILRRDREAVGDTHRTKGGEG